MTNLDLGIIGNCQISALINKQASIVWCCMPRFDSPAVFAQLLDIERGGSFGIDPVEPYEISQEYVRNSNVLVTRFEGSAEAFEVIDFAPRYQEDDRYYRPTKIVRIVRPLRGAPQIRITCDPRFFYGRDEPQVHASSSVLSYSSGKESLHLSTNIALSHIRSRTPFALVETAYMVLSYASPFQGSLRIRCEEMLERTTKYWQNWSKHCAIPSDYQDAVLRSALALKLHMFEDTGAIIAATTTSIPECEGAGRTWDYRYCWLRDAYFVIAALNRLGQFEEMEHFIYYLQNVSARHMDDRLQPVYGIGGESNLHEETLPWLAGYRGEGPVRIGNQAYTHHQHDVYGEMVMAIAPLFFDQRLLRHDQRRVFQNVRRLVEKAITVASEADAGIWEFRSDHRHYLFSKLMCWSAVNVGVRIARKMNEHALADRWVPELSRIGAFIENGWNPQDGHYSQAIGCPTADASNLLMSSLHYIDGKDPRFVSMVDSYSRSLLQGSTVFRYLDEDDFGRPRNAFSVCTFWMIDALAQAGRVDEARELFDNVLKRRNHLGLLSEDMDPVTGELWGNFPQTYSHVGIINSAVRLSGSWDDLFRI